MTFQTDAIAPGQANEQLSLTLVLTNRRFFSGRFETEIKVGLPFSNRLFPLPASENASLILEVLQRGDQCLTGASLHGDAGIARRQSADFRQITDQDPLLFQSLDDGLDAG